MLSDCLEEISVVANGVPNESDNNDILKYFFLPLYLLKSIKDSSFLVIFFENLLLFFLLSRISRSIKDSSFFGNIF